MGRCWLAHESKTVGAAARIERDTPLEIAVAAKLDKAVAAAVLVVALFTAAARPTVRAYERRILIRGGQVGRGIHEERVALPSKRRHRWRWRGYGKSPPRRR